MDKYGKSRRLFALGKDGRVFRLRAEEVVHRIKEDRADLRAIEDAELPQGAEFAIYEVDLDEPEIVKLLDTVPDRANAGWCTEGIDGS